MFDFRQMPTPPVPRSITPEPQTPEEERVLHWRRLAEMKQPELREKMSWLKSDPVSAGSQEFQGIQERYRRDRALHQLLAQPVKPDATAIDLLATAYARGISSRMMRALEKKVDRLLQDRIKDVLHSRGFTPSAKPIGANVQGVLTISDSDLKYWLALMGVGEMNWTLEDRIVKAMQEMSYLQGREPYRRHDDYDFFKTTHLPQNAEQVDALIQQVLALRKGGYSPDQIAVELQLKPCWVKRLLSKPDERTSQVNVRHAVQLLDRVVPGASRLQRPGDLRQVLPGRHLQSLRATQGHLQVV
jgi:hypothetical protein